MAIFRKLHTTFWTDPFVENLTQEQKLFYLYLISNTKTKQCGIYEISKKYMSYETGFTIPQVNELINYFVGIGKIFYSESTNEVAICNWWKYNWSESPKTIACIRKELLEVKDTLLIGYLYSTDKLSIVYPSSINTPLIEHTYSMHTESQEEEEEEQAEVKVKGEEEEKVEVTYSPQMISIITSKFAEHITDRFKLNHFLIEINEDWGGWDNFLDICFGDDISVRNNYNNRLNQYRNGIFK
jgi:hypothetical protein